MKTLHLNLIKIWFDKIFNLEKPEEYREIKPYWCSRLLTYKNESKSYKWWDCYMFYQANPINTLLELIKTGDVKFKHYDTITFSNGMTPPVPRFEIELNSIKINTGNKEWGAIPSKLYFVLYLGKHVL